MIIRGLIYIFKLIRLFLDPSILTITSCSGQSEKNWEKFASKLFEENFFFKALKLLVQLFKVRRILLPYYLKFSFSLRFLRPAQNFGLFRPYNKSFFPALCKYNIIIIIITVLFISSVEIQIMTIEAVVIVSLLLCCCRRVWCQRVEGGKDSLGKFSTLKLIRLWEFYVRFFVLRHHSSFELRVWRSRSWLD